MTFAVGSNIAANTGDHDNTKALAQEVQVYLGMASPMHLWTITTVSANVILFSIVQRLNVQTA